MNEIINKLLLVGDKHMTAISKNVYFDVSNWSDKVFISIKLKIELLGLMLLVV